MSRTSKPESFIPEKDFPKEHVFFGKPRCQAWSNNNGRQCLGFAMRGKRVCRFHGGSSLAGISSQRFRTGKYSKYLPTRMVERYNASQSDQELIDLKEEIKVINARIADVMLRVDTGEAGTIWRLARNAYNDLREAIIEEDKNKIRMAMSSLDNLLGKGVADYSAWDEVKNLFDLLRKTVDGQQRIEFRKMLYISIEEALGMQKSLISAVTKFVNDGETLNKIQNEWIALEKYNKGVLLDAQFISES